jgi:hypothetical protein
MLSDVPPLRDLKLTRTAIFKAMRGLDNGKKTAITDAFVSLLGKRCPSQVAVLGPYYGTWGKQINSFDTSSVCRLKPPKVVMMCGSSEAAKHKCVLVIEVAHKQATQIVAFKSDPKCKRLIEQLVTDGFLPSTWTKMRVKRKDPGLNEAQRKHPHLIQCAALLAYVLKKGGVLPLDYEYKTNRLLTKEAATSFFRHMVLCVIWDTLVPFTEEASRDDSDSNADSESDHEDEAGDGPSDENTDSNCDQEDSQHGDEDMTGGDQDRRSDEDGGGNEESDDDGFDGEAAGSDQGQMDVDAEKGDQHHKDDRRSGYGEDTEEKMTIAATAATTANMTIRATTATMTTMTTMATTTMTTMAQETRTARSEVTVSDALHADGDGNVSGSFLYCGPCPPPDIHHRPIHTCVPSAVKSATCAVSFPPIYWTM